VVIAIGAFPPDHSGAGKRLQQTYTTMCSLKNSENSHTSFQWHVVTLPARLESQNTDERNVSRIGGSKRVLMIARCVFLLARQWPQIVHCVGLSKITFSCSWAAKILRIPYIFELSIDPPESSLQQIRDKWFERPLKDACGFIALTPRIQALFKTLSSEKPIFLRPNPVTLSDNGVSDIPPKNSRKHLLLGRFTARKGQADALRTLSNLTNEHTLILAGPVICQADQQYLETLKSLAIELNISERVEFKDEYITNVQALMQEAGSIWCFSEREGLPNVVLEGLWTGIPAFVNRNLGLHHVIIDGFNGAHLPQSPSEKATIINIELNKGFNKKDIMRQAREEFDLPIHAAKTYTFIEQCLPKRNEL